MNAAGGGFWAVARTKPLQHRKAILNLTEQGYTCWVPEVRELVAVNGRRVVKRSPMFPRYVFIFISDRWRSIMSTRGVQELFLLGDVPHKIPEAKIAELRAVEEMQAREESVLGLKAGDSARVLVGALAGYVVLFEKCARKRVTVLLSMLGRAVRAEVGLGDLEPV